MGQIYRYILEELVSRLESNEIPGTNMLKMRISDWVSRIDRQFEANLFSHVGIGEKSNTQTKELTNFEFCLVPEEIVEKVAPPNPEEHIERDFIVDKSSYVSDMYLSHDIHSRRAAFVNNYDGVDNHCISYFHHYIRDNKYCMNVYVRSMNYKDNFVFDCQTFNLAYHAGYDNAKLHHSYVKQGFIRVFVFSLHIYD